jgi:hypothetical protein
MMGKMNKWVLFAGGSVCLVIGIALILLWWSDVVGFFRAVGALLLALGGLVLLYMVKD